MDGRVGTDTGTLLDLDTEFELIVMENPDSVIRCQSEHRMPNNETCTVTVVARKVSCTTDFLICQASLDWNRQMLLSLGDFVICHGSDHKIKDCWTLPLV